MEKELLPKLRTINQLYDDIHTLDVNSPVSKGFIKKIILKDKIPYISVGVKKMYDENVVFEHIKKSFTSQRNDENIFM